MIGATTMHHDEEVARLNANLSSLKMARLIKEGANREELLKHQRHLLDNLATLTATLRELEGRGER